MYQNAALLAAFLLVYSAIAGRIERSLISGPIVFTGVGFLLGPDGLGVLRMNVGGIPFSGSPNGFWVVAGLITVVFALVATVLFRFRFKFF